MKPTTISQNDLIGIWGLNNYSVMNLKGENILLWGENAEGLLVYLNNDHMSVHVSNKNRPHFACNDFLAGTTDEITAAFEGYTAYYGKYELQGDNIIHHYVNQSAYPNWNGVTHKRFISLNPPELTLSTPPILINGELCTMRMYWKRID